MSASNMGPFELFALIPLLLVWAVGIALTVWFVRTLASIAASLRDVAARLSVIEQIVRDTPASTPPRTP